MGRAFSLFEAEGGLALIETFVETTEIFARLASGTDHLKDMKLTLFDAANWRQILLITCHREKLQNLNMPPQ